MFYCCSIIWNKKLSYRRETARQLHVFLGSLTDRALHWAPHLFYNYNRLAKLVSTLSANKPCDIRTLSWIGHSRSFKVILIGAGRNPERCVVVMCNRCRRYFWNLGRYGNGKTGNSSISTAPLKIEDVPERNAFEYLQMIYIARNVSYWPTFLSL